jgi:hypothetical protein
VSDSVYRLEFPENQAADGYMLLKVEINRFTAAADRVIGRDYTTTHEGHELKLHAVSDSGKCVPTKGAIF